MEEWSFWLSSQIFFAHFLLTFSFIISLFFDHFEIPIVLYQFLCVCRPLLFTFCVWYYILWPDASSSSSPWVNASFLHIFLLHFPSLVGSCFVMLRLGSELEGKNWRTRQLSRPPLYVLQKINKQTKNYNWLLIKGLN